MVALYVPDGLRFLHYLCEEQFCLKIVIEYQFAKIMCAYTALLSLFLTKYIVWMTVQIMLTAESLLPACEWTAMHEKKGLNDSYVFSVHGIYLTRSAISNLRTMDKTTTTKYCLNLPVILCAQALK